MRISVSALILWGLVAVTMIVVGTYLTISVAWDYDSRLGWGLLLSGIGSFILKVFGVGEK